MSFSGKIAKIKILERSLPYSKTVYEVSFIGLAYIRYIGYI